MQGRLIVRLHFLVVATEAEVTLGHSEVWAGVGSVWRVAIEAFIAGEHGLMIRACLLGVRDDFVMAFAAELSLIGEEHEGIWGAVSVVALRASVSDRPVDILRALDALRDLFMTIGAKLDPHGHEQCFVLRGVRVMALGARTDGGWAVYYLLGDTVGFMALKA